MNYLPADVLVFSGSSPVSRMIRAATCSRWSHVGISVWVKKSWVQYCLKANQELLDNWRDRYLLFEATTLGGSPCEITGRPINGVQAHSLAEYVDAYDGHVSVLRWPVCRWLDKDLVKELAIRAMDCIGRPYDEPGAALSATQWLKKVLRLSQDRSRLYCVEFVAELIRGFLGEGPEADSLNPGQMTPGDYVRWATSHGWELQQVK